MKVMIVVCIIAIIYEHLAKRHEIGWIQFKLRKHVKWAYMMNLKPLRASTSHTCGIVFQMMAPDTRPMWTSLGRGLSKPHIFVQDFGQLLLTSRPDNFIGRF